MPIYEFYCQGCNTIFNFFSRRINTEKVPACPKCDNERLERRVSLFSVTGRAKEGEEGEESEIDEVKIEKAMDYLMRKADRIDENDPKQAAEIMRKMTDMSGIRMGDAMEEALSRMENGEDPERLEEEMGDVLENEEPFLLQGKGQKKDWRKRRKPFRDDTLYDL